MCNKKYWSYEEAAREVFGIYAGTMMTVVDLGPTKKEALELFTTLINSRLSG